MGVRPFVFKQYIGHDKYIGQRKGSIQKVCLSQVDTDTTFMAFPIDGESERRTGARRSVR